MTELTTQEVEREIIRYDKQSIITYCLKLFETNRQLVDKNIALYESEKNSEEKNNLLKEVNRQLIEMSVYKFFKYKIKHKR